MEFSKFEIKNFKGVKHIAVDLERTPRSKIYTFVGLNESGKTTILEALSLMSRQPYDLRKTDPSQGILLPTDYQAFIPVSERYNFNGNIELISTLKFSEDDKERVEKFLLDSLNYKLIEFPTELKIRRCFSYKNSVFDKTSNVWDLMPLVRKKKGRTEKYLGFPEADEEWQQLASFIGTLIPSTLYFSNEVFNLPEYIYISKSDEKRKDETDIAVNKFYCEVVQDILFAIDPNLNLQTHLVARKTSNKPADNQALTALLQKMGQEITNTVMRQWERIFSRPLKDKRVQVICEKNGNGQVHLQIRLEDGGELFDIKERSTGFRWFFVFILLTQYRGHRKESAMFLYDEPASNLHSAAQQQLIDCFDKLPQNFTVLYSTHSHYLINPDWLDSTMVVRNEAVNSNDPINLDSAKTDIKLLPYRQFVSENPSGLSYFQPILDVLQFVPSKLELTKPPLLVEGKSDFYTLNYLAKTCLNIELPFDIIPCLGSGTLDQLIALYSGWGKPVAVLLDSDKAGRIEKERYEKKFGALVRDRIICYGDIDASWEKWGLEKIIGKTDLLAIQQKVYKEPYKKSMFNLAIQELHLKKETTVLSPELINSINKIVNSVKFKLQ